jgi:hypothetical protein
LERGQVDKRDDRMAVDPAAMGVVGDRQKMSKWSKDRVIRVTE